MNNKDGVYENFFDIVLINPLNGAKYNVHKAILASGSKYFQDVFVQFPKIKEVIAPLPYNQKEEGSSDDQVSRILKYLYNNQNFEVIRPEITEKNYFSLYSQIFALRCEKLINELT